MPASSCKLRHIVLLGLSLCAVPPGTAFAEMPQQGDTPKGKVLTDSRGMTLYTYDLDPVGQATCVDACASTWNPMMAERSDEASGGFTLIPRNGARQWAYKGKALYYWIDDKNPGDTKGDRINLVWRIARP